MSEEEKQGPNVSEQFEEWLRLQASKDGQQGLAIGQIVKMLLTAIQENQSLRAVNQDLHQRLQLLDMHKNELRTSLWHLTSKKDN